MKNDFNSLSTIEKLRLLTGKDVWNVTDNDKLDSFSMADGPNGLRKEIKVHDKTIELKSIAYPSCHMLANSWNKEIVKEVASCLADDCIDNEVDMLLAPAINIKRDPRCGRNFEYLSEDPYLAGTLAKEYIDGLQEKGIGTSVKHYCGNNAESNRQSCNNIIDRRTLMEIYTRNFYYAIKANPTSIMCAYNKINGSWCSENVEINDILYNKLGFNGAIISDWGAVHNKANSIKAGLALQMPYREGAYEEAKEAYDNGDISLKELDYCTSKTVNLIQRIQEMRPLRKVTHSVNERSSIARISEEEGIVLLKNKNNILPIKKASTIGITGYFDELMYVGGGSGNTKCNNKVLMLDEALRQVNCNAKVLTFDRIITPTTAGNVVFNYKDANEIVKAYKDCDYVIVQVGTWFDIEGEGFDRNTIRLPEVAEAYLRFIGTNFKGKTIVQLTAGSAIDVSSWIDYVDALIYSGFGGQCVNEAVAYILFGNNCPSGKLCETFPKRIEDISCLNSYNEFMTENKYSDGIYVGYRHYDKNNIEPMFEFGFGLSYSTFEYLNLKLIDKGDYILVSYDIKNVGNYDAKEVSQIYYSAPSKEIDRPIKELCGYSKDYIKKGETKNIIVRVDKESLCYFNVDNDEFTLERGIHTIMVGASSKDIRIEEKIEL